MSGMQSQRRGLVVLLGVVVACAAAVSAGVARADVTIEEKSTFELPIFKAHASSTESFSADKKRRDYEMNCEGLMSMLCGKAQSGEIVRLDKSMSYQLEPKKKRYREQPFPTEAERKELQKRLADNMEKMKQCAAQQPTQQAIDTSKCQMSKPKVEVKNLGADGQILGHDVHRSTVNLTTSCTNKETNDVCDMQFGFDVWLTGDKVPGLEDRVAFEKAYMTKMGLTGEGSAVMAQQVQQILAPYAEQMKELKAKSGDLKGQALRTSFHMAYGGAHCAAAAKSSAGGGAGGMGAAGGSGDMGQQAKDAVAQSTAEVAASKVAGNGVAGSIASRAMSSVGGKFLSGMFSKKKQPESTDPAAATTAAKPAEPAAPGMLTMVTVTTETTAVRTELVAADRFEVPADWKKIVPKAAGKEEPFTCPKADKGQ